MRVLVIFCTPGLPSAAVRASYRDAFEGVNPEFIWITPAGYSSVFTRAYRNKKASGDLAAIEAKCREFEKVVLVTFSAGYGFPREWFKEGGIELVDCYLSIDSIHGTHALDNISQFVEFAKTKKLFLIHTDIEPFRYASTTDVALALMESGAPVVVKRVAGETAAAHIKAFNVSALDFIKSHVVPYLLVKEEVEMLKGIDISHHQPNKMMNWEAVANEVDFVIARATYGRRADAEYELHKDSSSKAGLPFGAYHFFRQTQTPEEQFEAFASNAGLSDGDLLPIVDLEDNAKYDGSVSAEAYNTKGKKLCDLLASKYGGCIIYISYGFWQRMGSPAWVLDHHIWTAHWGVDKPFWPDATKGTKKDWAIWQYGVKKVPSLYEYGPLDLNYAKELPLIDTSEVLPDDKSCDHKACNKEKVFEHLNDLSVKLEDVESALRGVETLLEIMVRELVDN